MEKIYMLSGMSCSHCSDRVRAALLGTKGVLSAEVSHETGIARVEFDEKLLSAEDIKSAILDTGFELAEEV